MRPGLHRAPALLGLLLLSGCLEAHASECLDMICPGGFVCAEDIGRCVLPEQIEACVGLVDDDPCSYGAGTGFCYLGYCQAFDCGDGQRDGDPARDGEVCDDGNALGGDGCSADCRSDETCGNGVVDTRVGERCDDGNTVDGDGCQADCALPTCGDGIVDPGEVCDDGNDQLEDGCNTRCSSDETCGNGVVDAYLGEECDEGPSVSFGCGSTCRIPRCGNGVLDPLELCDDGNFDAGDGCGPACDSDETCGNGVVDFGVGEQCDDGNLRSHDGCSSRCTAELPLFTEKSFGAPARRFAQMVYDAANDRFVLFGGEGPVGEPMRGTEVFQDRQWTRLAPVGTEPPPRVEHVLVYDAARRHVLVFGGRSPEPGRPSGFTPLGDTWVLRGRAWEQLTSLPIGPLRGATAAYDAAREEVVLFGGQGSGRRMAQTWVHDGIEWRLRAPSVSPPARVDAQMVYDSVRERVVLFGGHGASVALLEDTWEWDGVDWTQRAAATHPVGMGAAAFDAERGVTVGLTGMAGDAEPAIWEWNGLAWSQPDLTEGPIPRWGAAVAYRPGWGVAMRSGTDRTMGPSFDDFWTYDGDWTTHEWSRQPGALLEPAGAFDSRTREVVLFGGRTAPPSLSASPDQWSYDGSHWTLRDRVEAPPMTHSFSEMVDDAAHHRLLAVRPGPTEMETWAFRDGHWAQVQTVGAPPYRRLTTLVYDATRQVVVLFGGSRRNDTWELDGDTWTERTPAVSPPERSGAFGAFDPLRGEVVIFGGRDDARRDDTWEWNGTRWREVVTELRPRPRDGRGMDYFPARRSIILAGGNDAYNDVWEFDGMRWTRLSVPLTFEPRASPLVVTDRERDVIVLASGDPNATTWEFGFRSEVPDEVCSGGMDDDGDGLVDCEDPDCEEKACGTQQACRAEACVCRFDIETECADGLDGDCDRLVDCEDPDCAGAAWCGVEADCADGVDDDFDGATDCADPGCATVGPCELFETTCGDRVDNDGDGRADCADPDCFLTACARPS